MVTTLVEDRFSNLADVCGAGVEQAMALSDVGVSSCSSMGPSAGFRSVSTALADMRMSGSGRQPPMLLRASEADLANSSISSVRSVIRAALRVPLPPRKEAPITTTRWPTSCRAWFVEANGPSGDPHVSGAAIFVNEELDELHAALVAAEHVLKRRASCRRLVSLAGRSYRQNFLNERGKRGGASRHMPETDQSAPSFEILTKRPIVADDSEVSSNPRARSAKLRAARRTDAPTLSETASFDWPQLADVMRGG